MPRASVPLACLAAALLALPACGGDGGGSAADDPDRRARGGAARVADPVPTESVDDAVDRIRGAVTAEGCEAVKGLLHSTYGEITDAACDAVRAELGSFADPRGARYGTGAAIDFEAAGGRARTAALALDADGTFRIAFVMDAPGATVGTERPAAFDRAAVAVVAAMQRGDCDSFLRLAARDAGLGVGPDAEVCRRVSDVPFRSELVANRAARPVAMGGNAWLAFYRLRTRRDAYYTLVMARQASRGGAPRYVLVDALPAA